MLYFFRFARFAALFVLALLLCAAGCGSSERADEAGVVTGADGPTHFRLVVDIEDLAGRYAITSNGFPVRTSQVLGRTASARVHPRLNTALIGTGNVAAVEVEPAVRRSGERLSFGPVAFTARVERSGEVVAGTEVTRAHVDSAYASWQRRAKEKWQGYLSREGQGGEAWAADSMRWWMRQHPMTVATGAFDAGEGAPDFSALFDEEAPRIEGTAADSARLIGYAIRLRDLMVAKDTTALAQEFATAFGARCSELANAEEQRCLKSNRSNIVLDDEAGEELGFTKAEVRLRKWASGRVWELHRASDKPLLRRIRVFVGMESDNLHVARCCIP